MSSVNRTATDHLTRESDGLQKSVAAEAKKEVNLRAKINRANDAAGKTKSSSVIQSKMREAERAAKDLAAVHKKRADLSGKMADKGKARIWAPCMVAIYGVYDENNRALMHVIAAVRSGNVAKMPRDYHERMAHARAETDYERRVRNKTRATYKAHKGRLNPDNRLIGPSGVDGAHHLDHIVPIRQCFRCDVPVEDAAAPENLQVVPWYINTLRGELRIDAMVRSPS